MGFINEWITSIVLLILLAVVLEMLLPNSQLKNYVKLTVSLMLLLFLLQPILSLFHEDPDEWLYSLIEESSTTEYSVEEKINSQKKEIDKFFDAYTSEQVAVQLKDQAKSVLAESYQMEITHIALNENTQGEMLGIHVLLAPMTESSGENEATERIKPVSIVIGDDVEPEELSKQDEELISLLAEIWEVPETVITLEEEGDG
ncbi:stage III sporulation protein AF [Alkalihalobacillus xiaoxiensis]|uniref:Stage III sporulation protein AF n=1 Tax=Shouchella xiaoxiensis TaxID=766895 RepID=A0ABS2SXP5_9BACI|nr:stage III sporulation protein AF [Shouchella xiaoxiensis]